jgi:hypothetical protein
MKTGLFVVMLCFVALLEVGSDKRKTPADADMTAHFRLHEAGFETLRSMIENDTLSHYPLFAQEKRDSVPLSVSAEREAEYQSLMNEIQVLRFEYYPEDGKNTILFYYFKKGNATWGIDKGFEYVNDRTNEQDKDFTEKELYDTAIELNQNCRLYKKINDRWNLFIMYDR